MKFLSKNLGGIAAAAMMACWGFPVSSHAATANVTVNNSGVGFVPATTNISTGDTVLWTWPAGSFNHNVQSTSTPQAWPASSIMSGPATFSNTFTTPGSYPYECIVHGFTGSIIVNSTVSPPAVQITRPANGAVFAMPASVTIQANASESGGTITNVQFRVGSTVLTNETAGPFAVTASITSAGSNTLSAVATDAGGVKATNSVTINVVTPSPLVVTAPARSGGTNFQFMYSANAGLSYVVLRSTNLLSANWQTLATNTASGSSVSFTDENVTANPAYYRVVRLPNP